MRLSADTTMKVMVGSGVLVPPAGLEIPPLRSRSRHGKPYVSHANTRRLLFGLWFIGTCAMTVGFLVLSLMV